MSAPRFLLLIIVASVCASAWSAPGDVDPSFAPVAAQLGRADKLALLPDGRLLINTHSTVNNIIQGVQARRLHSDGSMDGGFVAGLAESPDVVDLLVQPDGRVLMALNAIGPDTSIVRLLPDGALDAGFTDTTASPNAYPLRLALQADGKVLVGQLLIGGAQQTDGLRRLNADGSPDSAFQPQVNGRVTAIALQEDGKILIGGEFTSAGGETGAGVRLARLFPDGRLDKSFAPHPSADALGCLAVLPDGKILVGGVFTSMGGLPLSSLVRLNTDGSLDLSFQTRLNTQADGQGVAGAVYDLAVQADGKVVIVGDFARVDDEVRHYVARLLPDGRVDATFLAPTSGVGHYEPSLQRVVLQSNGRPVVVRSQWTSAPQQVLRLLSDAANQSLVVSGKTVRWVRGGSAPEILEAVFELSQDHGRSYTLLGKGKKIPGGWELGDLRLPASGQVRVSANHAGCRGGFGGRQMVTQTVSFGRLPAPEIMVEETQTRQWIGNGGLWSLDPTSPGTTTSRTLTVRNPGDLDLKLLATRIIGPNADAFTITRVPDSRVPGGGGSTVLEVSVAPSSTGLLQATLQLSTNDREALIYDIQLRADVRLSDDATLRQLRTGQTSEYYGGITFALSSFKPETISYTIRVSSSEASLNIVPVPAHAAAAVKINGVAGRTQWNLHPGQNLFTIKVTAQDGVTTKTYTLNVEKPLPSPGGIDAEWPINNAEALAVEPDGSRIIGGAFTLVDGQSAPGLIKLRSDGERDVGYAAGVTGGAMPYVRALCLQPDLKLIAGGVFTQANGVPRVNLARFHRDGTLDTGFDTGVMDGTVDGLVLQEDGRIIVLGSFTQVGGVARQGILRLNTDGTLDTAFAPVIAGGTVLSAAVQADGGIVLGGTFSDVNGSARQRLARLNSDGTVDPAFAPTADAAVRCVAVEPDGSLLVSGAFAQINGSARPCLARLSSAGVLDTGFNPPLSSPTAQTRVLVLLQANGSVVAGGSSLPGMYHGRARFLANGSLDSDFIAGNPSSFVTALLQDDGHAVSVIGTKVYLFTTGAPVQSLQAQSTRIDWQRGGSLPVAQETWFDLSTDGGATYTYLGKGSRVPGGWALTGLQLPTNGQVRARARTLGGNGVNCSGILESVTVFGGRVAAPEIAIKHNGTNVPDSSSVTFPAAYALEKNLLPLMIQNTGEVPLRLTDFTFSGPDAAKFSIANYPSFEMAGPGGASTLIVQMETGAPEPVSATLHIESNDADEGSYDIALTATAQPSRNADLKSLSVSGIHSLSPLFSSKVTEYQMSMNPLFSSAMIKPTAEQPVASITVNGQVVPSGAFSNSIPMEVGATTVTVVVTALDGVTTQTYTLSLVRKIGGQALPFQIDASFLDHGMNCSAEQPGGQTIVGGNFQYLPSNSSFLFHTDLVRFHANGAFDGTLGGVSGLGVECVATLSDGRWLAGGNVDAYGLNAHASNLLRYSSTGKLDGNFQANVRGTLRCMGVQQDGKVLIGGNFSIDGPNSAVSLARLHSDGTVDTNFRPVLAFGTQQPDVRSLALQPDGKVLIAGSFSTVNGFGRSGAARLNADGTLDTTFTSPFTNGSLNCIQVLPDGRLLVGGSNANGSGRLARLSATGGQDGTFQPSLNGVVNSLALQADGKVIVGGGFSSAASATRTGVARFHTDGTLDSTFAVSLGYSPFQKSAIVWGAALQADGRVVLTGDFNYSSSPGLARLENEEATGALTAIGSRVEWLRGGSAPEILSAQFELSTDGGTTYTPLGMGTRVSGGWELTGLSLPSEGQLRATGRSTGGRYNGSSSVVQKVVAFSRAAVPALALRVEGGPVLSHEGTLDIGVVHPGSLQTLYLILSNTGEMPLTGMTRSITGADAGQFFTYVEGLLSNAQMQPMRGPGDERVFQFSYRAATGRPLGPISADLHIASNDPDQPDFVVHVTGTLAISTDASLAGLSVENTEATPVFSPAVQSYTAQVAYNKTEALIKIATAQAAASVVVSGSGGNYEPVPNSEWTYSVWLEPGENTFDIQVTAQDGTTTRSYTLDITRAEAPAIGDVDLAFDPKVEGNVQALAVQPDGRIIIGGSFFDVANASNTKSLARLMADGTRDTSFLTPSLDGQVFCVLVQPDGKIVIGGSFSTVSNAQRYSLARLNADGTLDTAFVANQGGMVNALALQPDGKLLVGGGFTKRVTRVNSNGSADTSFSPPTISSAVQSIALQLDGKILVAGSSNIANGSSLARLSANGTRDTTFAPAVTAVGGCLLQSDSKILVYGAFTTINGGAGRGLARLNADGTVDTSFDADLDNTVDNVVLQADGKIIMAGSFTTVAGVAQPYLARLDKNGTLDLSFRPFFSGNGILGLALQQDGGLLVGGSFNGAGGHSRSYLARLLYDSHTESLTVADSSRVQWLRGGATGEAESVVFDTSTDGGASWGRLGTAARMQGGWEMAGLSLPSSGIVRALASMRGGAGAGSSGLIEARQSYSGYRSPQLHVLKGAQRLADGSTIDLGKVLTVATKSVTLTLKNAGSAPLTGIAVTLGGNSAYTLMKRPPAVLMPGKSAVLEVRFGSINPGSFNDALQILSNDVHFSPFDVQLAAEVPQPPSIPAPVNYLEMLNEGLRHTLTFAFITASEPRVYQWRKNGVLLPSQKSNAIHFHPARLSDAGVYTLTVICPDGRAVSEPLYVGVIRQSPSLARARLGGQITLSAVASAPPGTTLEYQWIRVKDGGDIYLGTGRSQTLSNLSASDDASYFCYVGLSLYGPGQGSLAGNTGYTKVIVDDAPQLLPFALPAVYVGEKMAFKIPALGGPLHFTASGLPKGLVVSSDGVLTGSSVGAGVYQPVFTVSNLSGTHSTLVPWTILPLPLEAMGIFAGLIDRAPMNDNLGGNFAITSNASGSFTGYVLLGGERIPLAGVLDMPAGGGNPELRFKVRPYAPESVLVMNTATQTIAGVLVDGVKGSASCAGLRNVWSQANPSTSYVGRFNAGLVPPSVVFSDATTYPHGTGYLQMNVLSLGAVIWSGHLSDGSVVLHSVFVGPGGEVPLHAPLYSNQSGSLNGWSLMDSSNGYVDGALNWSKQVQSPTSRARSYAAGFPLHELTLTGAKYVPPTPGTLVLGLPPAPPENARIVFSSGGFLSPFSQPFTVSGQNSAVMPMLNPLQVLVFLAPASGRFSGSFTLSNYDLLDATPPNAVVRRVTTFQGALIARPGMSKGVGHFNLVELPDTVGETLSTTPQWSGKIELSAP